MSDVPACTVVAAPSMDRVPDGVVSAAFAVAAFAVAAFAVAALVAVAAGEAVAGVVLLLTSVAADAPPAVSTQSAAAGATIHRTSFGLAFHAARAFEGKPTITTFLSPYLTGQDQGNHTVGRCLTDGLA